MDTNSYVAKMSVAVSIQTFWLFVEDDSTPNNEKWVAVTKWDVCAAQALPCEQDWRGHFRTQARSHNLRSVTRSRVLERILDVIGGLEVESAWKVFALEMDEG